MKNFSTQNNLVNIEGILLMRYSEFSMNAKINFLIHHYVETDLIYTRFSRLVYV